MRRSLVLAVVVTIGAGVSCASRGAVSPELRAELDQFYRDWSVEVSAAIRDLDEGGRRQLMSVWPRAEFEADTEDVLTVLSTQPSLAPTVRRLRRFLQQHPPNRVQSVLRTEPERVRLWKTLVDTINAELGRPSSTDPRIGGSAR